MSNTSQCYCSSEDADLEIAEEPASEHSMHETTTGMDIFREVEKSVDGYSLQSKKLKGITADNGRNICGAKKSLVKHIKKRLSIQMD